jgi:NAD(P)H-dependent FMN reductase
MDLIIFTKNQIKTKNMGIATKSANTQFLIVINHNLKKVTRFLYANTLPRSLLLGTPDM